MSIKTKYSILDLKRDFPNDGACLDLIFDTLHSRKCSCGGDFKRVSGRKKYQCSKCRFQIAPTAGTIFHKSDTPLASWLHAIFIFSNAKSGISAKEMERQLGVTYKCAWRILSLIRQSLKQSNTKLRGDVEIDTGYIGGRHYGGKNNERLGEAMAKKSVITVACERGGKIRAEIVPNSYANVMNDFIQRNIETKATTLYTDSSPVYKGVAYDKVSVNHSKKEFVRGDVHINTIETFFAHLKRSIKGTYKVISKQHLQSYLDSFVFHYNNRYNDKERFGVLLGTLLHASK